MNSNKLVTKNKVEVNNLPEAADNYLMPPMFSIYLLDDDVTPLDFVTDILLHIFFFTEQQAIDMLSDMKINGRTKCGVYTKDVAETKVMVVHDYAASNGYKLRCIVERA